MSLTKTITMLSVGSETIVLELQHEGLVVSSHPSAVKSGQNPRSLRASRSNFGRCVPPKG